MLFTNVTVSKKILRHCPTLSVLRRHPSPNRSMFDGLISKSKCQGFEIDAEDSKRLAGSLDTAAVESDPCFNKLLRILSTRCMPPAQSLPDSDGNIALTPFGMHLAGIPAPPTVGKSKFEYFIRCVVDGANSQ